MSKADRFRLHVDHKDTETIRFYFYEHRTGEPAKRISEMTPEVMLCLVSDLIGNGSKEHNIPVRFSDGTAYEIIVRQVSDAERSE